jgi:voltage-gated potassium channel
MQQTIGNHKHLLLLAAMLLGLVTQPLVSHESTASKVASDLLIAAITVSVLVVVFEDRWERCVALVLAAPAVVLSLGLYGAWGVPNVAISVAYHVSIVLFFGFVVGVIVRDAFRLHVIGFDDILGVSFGYLLLGIVWGSLYVLVEVLAPGSFAVSPDIRWQLDDLHLRRALFNYLSFANMTSLGYSAVVSVTPVANTLTWLEVMSAQFYLAVVIAQIVGMKLAKVVGPRGGGIDAK